MFVSFTDQRPVLIDSLGNPLSYGEVTFCDQGMTTPKTIYSDEARSVALTNPQILDISGRPVDQIFLGVGDYTCFVKRFIGADILTAIPSDWTDDNQFDLSGLESPVSIATTATVDTIADLKNIDSDVYQSVTVLGYFAKGDCPARIFIWSASEAGAENLGTIVSSSLSVSGRWMYQPIAVIDIRTFGAVPGGVNCNGAITNAEAWANSLTNHAVTIYFPKGVYSVSGTVTQPMRVPVAIDAGVTILNTVAGNYKLDIQSVYHIDLETALQSVSSVGSAGLRFSGIREGVVNFKWLGENEVGFGRFIADVDSNYHLRINEQVDATLIASGGTKQCRLSFGPSGSFILDGAGYEIQPLSIINENTDGCFYYVVTGLLDLGLLSSVNTSWFRSTLDSALLFNGTYQHAVGTVLNVDADCTVLTEVSTNSGWVINAQGGIINIGAGLTCGTIQAGDIGLFNGDAVYWVAHEGMTNLAWFIYANADKNDAFSMAIESAIRSTSTTLDGRRIVQAYTTTKTNSGAITFKNVISTGVKFTLLGAVSFIDCNIIGSTYALYSTTSASITVSNSLIYGESFAITSNGNTVLDNSTINGVVDVSGTLDADHCKFGPGSIAGYIKCTKSMQVTNSQIKNEMYSTDTAGMFGDTMICNNVFIGVGSTKPNWTLQATTASSVVPSVIIKNNIFTGTYSGATEAFAYSLSGAGTFANNPHILICDNKSTSANCNIKATKGIANTNTNWTYSAGTGCTTSTVSMNLPEVFLLSTVPLNTYDNVSGFACNVVTGVAFGALAMAYISSQSFVISLVGLTTGAGPNRHAITFEIYR